MAKRLAKERAENCGQEESFKSFEAEICDQKNLELPSAENAQQDLSVIKFDS